MKRLASSWRNLCLLATTAGSWAILYGTAWAQGSSDTKTADSVPAQPFVGPYALVIFAVALGLLIVCNSSRRRDRAKPEQYEDKLAKELAMGHQPGH